jgi:hypothetical protein
MRRSMVVCLLAAAVWLSRSCNAQYSLGSRGFGFGAAAPYAFLLDSVSGAVNAAYSTRQLRSAYSGYALEVERTSDNTTQNIGFTSAHTLDTTTMNAFCASTSCWVTTWYDQSGNSRNISEPYSMFGAGTSSINGKPAIYFYSWTGTYLNGNIPGYALNIVMEQVSQTSSKTATLASTSNADLLINCDGNGTYYFGTSTSSGCVDSAAAIALNTPTILTMDDSSHPAGVFWVNGVSRGTYSGSSASGYTLSNANGGSLFGGYVSELIIFSQTMSTSDRQAIEHNQESFYNISGS